MLYLYCDLDVIKSRDIAAYVMASLLGQLLDNDGYDTQIGAADIPEDDEYDSDDSCEQRKVTLSQFLEKGELGQGKAEGFLLDHLSARGRTDVRAILDISGEPSSSDNDAQKLVNDLGRLNIHLMTFSRHHLHFPNRNHSVRLEVNATADDVKRYVRAQFARGSWVDALRQQKGLQGEIQSSVARISYGM